MLCLSNNMLEQSFGTGTARREALIGRNDTRDLKHNVSTDGHAQVSDGSCWQESPPPALERLWAGIAAEKGIK